ncbi:MAG: ATP-binding protein [Thiomicrospira sp.]
MKQQQELKFIKWFYWPFVFAFVVVFYIAFHVHQLLVDSTDQQNQAWQQLRLEQQKITHLTNLLSLRARLKLSLGRLLIEQEAERSSLVSELARLREQIIRESERLRTLADTAEEARLIARHSATLDNGLHRQFYYQSLIQDFDDMPAAAEYYHIYVRPIQDHADTLLADYYLVIKHQVEQLQAGYDQANTAFSDKLQRALWLVLVLLLAMVALVTWFAASVKRRLEFYATELEEEVSTQTAALAQAHNQAQQSLAELQSLLDSAPDGILQISPQGRILASNPAIERIFGFREDELVGESVEMLMPVRFRHKHQRYIETFSAVGRAQPMMMGPDGVVKAQHKLGWEFPIHAAIGEIKHGERCGFTVIVRDVSKQAELERASRQQNALLEALWQANNQFMIFKDIAEVANYLLTHVIQVTESAFGFIGEVVFDEQDVPTFEPHALRQIEWDAPQRVFFQPQADGERFVCSRLNSWLKAIMLNQEIVTFKATLDESGVSPVHSFIGVPIFYGNKLVGVYGLANHKAGYSHDMVEFLTPFTRNYGALIYYKRMLAKQDKLNQDLIAQRLEAEKANQAKSAFLSSMSHELRTPLNSVLGFAQLLSRNPSLTALQRDSLQEIEKAGQHLLSLVGDVLDLAKIESGYIDLTLAPVALRPLLIECQDLIRPLAQAAQISLHIDFPADDWAVRADRTRLKQVLVNLLSNAVKYNKPQGDVWVKLVLHGAQRVNIEVSDNGRGIAQDKRDGLFQPFNRLGQEGGAIEGTGIGLSISKTLIELMGGQIHYRPLEAGGSCFSLCLAKEQCPTGMGLSTQSVVPDDVALCVAGHKQVLYIEDNPANLKLVTQMLADYEGLTLHTAHDGLTGLSLANTLDLDLILLDINLPGLNGYEVIKQIRCSSELSRIPVIAITANALEEDARLIAQAGFNGYITKPIVYDTFIATLSRTLNGVTD